MKKKKNIHFGILPMVITVLHKVGKGRLRKQRKLRAEGAAWLFAGPMQEVLWNGCYYRMDESEVAKCVRTRWPAGHNGSDRLYDSDGS